MDWRLPLFGAVVGLLVGLTGMGGGVLMTPLLMLGFGLPPSVAVGTDLTYAALNRGGNRLAYHLQHNYNIGKGDRIAILAENDLTVKGTARVRHLLDVLATDLGADAIRDMVTVDLSHLTIAPYYGCQCLRPYPVFDDPEEPRSMEPLIRATGARIHPWQMGAKCCGASHMNTKMDVALELVHAILQAARGADAIVTVCPMCQMNLEAYQHKIGRLKNEDLSISIIYLPQLIGLALGLSEQELRLDLNLAVTGAFRQKLQQAA